MIGRRNHIGLAVGIAAMAAVGTAPAQLSVQFGHSHGQGYGNPYRGSGYNPYAGGAYLRGGHNDWYYDQYRPRSYGGFGHSDADHHTPRNWETYRNRALYSSGGPYNGYGYDDGHHHHP